MFSSIISPITSLTKKNTPFIWTTACQTALDTIKHAITNSPVLIYPDQNKQYHLFTDKSNHTWSGVLTQTRETLKENGKLDITYHPIIYQSGMFTLHQINWSTLVKEAYAIMMSFYKMAIYLHDAEVVIWSDHAPLPIINQKQNRECIDTKVGFRNFFNITLHYLSAHKR